MRRFAIFSVPEELPRKLENAKVTLMDVQLVPTNNRSKLKQHSNAENLELVEVEVRASKKQKVQREIAWRIKRRK